MAKNKLIQCPVCGGEMASKAKVCPHCGAKNKKPLFKRPLFWIIVILLLLVLGGNGCGSGSRKSSSASSAQASATEAPAQATAAPTEKTEAEPTEQPEEEPTAEPTEAPAESETRDETAIRSDFKEAMDSYEEFWDEYIDVLEKLQSNSTDLTLLTESAQLAAKADEVSAKFDAWESEDLTDAELAYYLEVSARVEAKLLKAGI